MKRLHTVVRAAGIEKPQRNWEDMRVEVLHEIQDGAPVDDAVHRRCSVHKSRSSSTRSNASSSRANNVGAVRSAGRLAY